MIIMKIKIIMIKMIIIIIIITIVRMNYKTYTKKKIFGRGLTNRGSQSWSRNKSWSEPGSINLDLDPMTLTYEINLDILKI